MLDGRTIRTRQNLVPMNIAITPELKDAFILLAQRRGMTIKALTAEALERLIAYYEAPAAK